MADSLSLSWVRMLTWKWSQAQPARTASATMLTITTWQIIMDSGRITRCRRCPISTSRYKAECTTSPNQTNWRPSKWSRKAMSWTSAIIPMAIIKILRNRHLREKKWSHRRRPSRCVTHLRGSPPLKRRRTHLIWKWSRSQVWPQQQMFPSQSVHISKLLSIRSKMQQTQAQLPRALCRHLLIICRRSRESTPSCRR